MLGKSILFHESHHLAILLVFLHISDSDKFLARELGASHEIIQFSLPLESLQIKKEYQKNIVPKHRGSEKSLSGKKFELPYFFLLQLCSPPISFEIIWN